MKRVFLLALSFMVLSLTCGYAKGGHNYYVDAENGNDNADGRSQQSAWRTLERMRKATFSPGDSLLLKRGSTFNEVFELSAEGTAAKPIVIDAYGTGAKPKVNAPDGSMYAVLLKNSSYVALQNIEVVNTGRECMAGRTGVKVVCADYGIARGVRLNSLYIHDVNGSLIKQEGGGSGILIENSGKKTASAFDGLIIENCVIRRCQRNGMIWSAYWWRGDWFPNRNVIVRRNLIEEVPGDGIVPIGCEGAVIEYNLMRRCPGTLPHSEAAAGIWPWSCDNTVIRFNEVSDHKAPWDAQGFDCDYNCRNTRIAYNYSHDNDGGMVLICSSGTDRGVGNVGSTVEYNVSINDAIRPRATRTGVFSANIHIAGPCRNTTIRRNILHVNPKTESFIDRSVITSDAWDGYADSTAFKENIFYAPEPTEIRLTQSTRNIFDGNYFLGFFRNQPADSHARSESARYEEIVAADPQGFNSLDFLFDTVIVGDGAAVLKAVNPEAISRLFDEMDRR